MKNIKDPSVAEWLLPNFSTTKTNDRVAASVSIMSSLQKFFDYFMCYGCGHPKITLLGVPEDYVKLRKKADRLLEFDLKDGLMTIWHEQLVVVLD